jgi:hypothetical protein
MSLSSLLQRVLGNFSALVCQPGREADHSAYLVPMLHMSGAIFLLPPSAFTVCTLSLHLSLSPKLISSLHDSCPTVLWLGELSNDILDSQHQNLLTHSPGVDGCCIALKSETEGLTVDNVKIKGPRFDYERIVKRRRGC